MAKTVCEIEGVPFDMLSMDWPLYRGVAAFEIRVPLSLAKYVELKQAFRAARGVVTMRVRCTDGAGLEATGHEVEIKGVRVMELVKASDLTCFMKLADARVELGQFVSVSNLNLKFKDGYVDGTRVDTMLDALRVVVRRALHLFAPDAFEQVPVRAVPDDLLTAGAAKVHTLEYLLSRFGVDLTCGLDGLLRFVGRGDLTGDRPLKQAYMPWLRGKVPGWTTEKRDRFRLPRKLRFYYKKRHMLLVPIRGYVSGGVVDNGAGGALSIEAEQVYIDDDNDKAVLTQDELLTKYAPNAVGTVTDGLIGKVIMSDNLDYPDGSKSPISRDGSAQRNKLARILKRDWRRLFRIVYSGDRGRWGGWTDMRIGMFAPPVTVDTRQVVNPPGAPVGGGQLPQAIGFTSDNVIEGGVRGEWCEFLTTIYGGGPKSIIGHSIITNYERIPPLPTMPFSGVWENEAEGIVRLGQNPLPDGNVAMPGRITNPDAMKVGFSKDPVVVDGDKVIYSRWQCRVPTWDKATISVDETAYLIIVATRRWPNNEEQFRVYEMDAFPDGNVPFQEFEVPELPALYDFVDLFGDIDGREHPPQGDSFGQQLNDMICMDDAATRRDVYMEYQSRQFEGEGVAAGLRGLNESVGGAIDQIILNIDGTVITTTIRCGNLSTQDERLERARTRRESRSAEAGGKVVHAK